LVVINYYDGTVPWRRVMGHGKTYVLSYSLK